MTSYDGVGTVRQFLYTKETLEDIKVLKLIVDIYYEFFSTTIITNKKKHPTHMKELK